MTRSPIYGSLYLFRVQRRIPLLLVGKYVIVEPIGPALSVSGALSASRYRAQRAKRKKESERLMVINEFVREIPRFLLTPAFLFFATLEIPTNDSRIKLVFLFSPRLLDDRKRKREKRIAAGNRFDRTRRSAFLRRRMEDPFQVHVYTHTHTHIYIDGDEPFTRTTKPRLRSHRT